MGTMGILKIKKKKKILGITFFVLKHWKNTGIAYLYQYTITIFGNSHICATLATKSGGTPDEKYG